MPFLEIIFNIIIVGVFLLYWGMAFIILYHLTRFGVGVQPKKFAAVFLLGSVLLSGTALILFMKIDTSLLISK